VSGASDDGVESRLSPRAGNTPPKAARLGWKCSSTKIKKNGGTANCKQRYRCKNCGRQFITAYTYLGRVESVRELIIPMALNGCGVRDVSRALFVSPNTALKTLRAAAATIPGLPVPSKAPDLEIDEFWSFVGSKRRPRRT